MNTILSTLKTQISSKLSDHPQCKPILKLIKTYTEQLFSQITKSLISIQMLMFQRDYPEVILKIDQLKCSFSPLSSILKKGYDKQAEREIKKSFQKQNQPTTNFLSHQLIPGVMSYDLCKPRLSDRQRDRLLGVSGKRRKEVTMNGEESSEKKFEKRGKREQSWERMSRGGKGKSVLDSSGLKLKIGGTTEREKRRTETLITLNKTLTSHVPTTTKRKVFK